MTMSTRTSRPADDNRKKTIWTVLGVGLLAAAVAGGGALSTLSTSIAGNQFRATVPGDGETPDGGLLRLTGQAIDHEFDSSVYNDLVRASWVLTNHGPQSTAFDGTFQTLADVDATLASALVVQYGETDAAGQVTRWVHGGTIAAPLTFAEALGIDAIDGTSQIPVEVRVLLEDPSLIASDVAEEIGATLRVAADFTVRYLDPLAQP